ncbi:MMPL family transporter [Aeromicrobium sp. A1-2]|uniref:MMPL family transporter n=1 Tax=Aeromicrobium sp. A1-2 TaxID=2107713 RepID=UPI0013C2F776|nr:MMPL family transporter [Aeromicrobium sp. A1-2]
MLRRLASLSVRFRWLVILTWLLLVISVGVLGQSIGGSFSNNLSVDNTDSQAAYATLTTKFPEMSGDGMQVVLHTPEGLTDPSVRDQVEDALADVRKVDGVASVQSPYSPAQEMVSEDGTTAMATIRFTERAADLQTAQIEAVKSAFGSIRDTGVEIEYGGAALNAESGPSGSEVIGLAAAVLVLLLAFGSVFAMTVPLITAVMALALGLGVIQLLAEWVTIGTSGPIVAAMIGLGVGIDYALLVVTRHREGLASGHTAGESIPLALSTAGRSVLVAGSTVIVAILSLYLIGIPFVATLGLASAITVATTLLAAVTLLPALLAVFGDNLDRFTIHRNRSEQGPKSPNGWHRWTRQVQRRPWPYFVASSALLLTLAAPLLDLQLGTADDGSAATGSTERKAYDLVASSFGAGWAGPLLVIAEYQGGSAANIASAGGLRETLASTEGVAQVPAPRFNKSGDTAVFTVVPDSSPDDKQTEDLVHHIRDTVVPETTNTTIHVGGATATAIDLADRLAARILWFMAFVVGLSSLLLLVEFRSIFVPIKAAVMNLLSVGAAYGAVVAVFQWGWLADLFGAQPGPIESFAPMMLFAVLFGLSMDYEVFLLSRVREEYVRTGDPGRSVADGVAATARVITAAAAVMVVVFASFLLNDQRVVNLFGFGLAVAIAIDATIVRMVLVPAAMSIAGRWAWYLPAWLDRLLPRFGLEPQADKESPAGH